MLNGTREAFFEGYEKYSRMVSFEKIEETLNSNHMLLELFNRLKECLEAIGFMEAIVKKFKKEDIKDSFDCWQFKIDKPRILENCVLVKMNLDQLIHHDVMTAIFAGLKRIRDFYSKQKTSILSEEDEEKLNKSVKIASDFASFLNLANEIWTQRFIPEEEKKKDIIQKWREIYQ